MKDRIISSYIKDFSEKSGFNDLDEAKVFEEFVNYCITSKHYPETFDLEAVRVGGGGDLGLDGLAILVNDHLVSSVTDVDYFKKAVRRLDVQFIFIQSKTSTHFDGGDIGTFISGVRQFFDQKLPKEANNAIRECHHIKEHIYASTIDMDHSPICQMYYVTTGNWNSELALQTRIDQGTEDLNETGLFSAVNFTPIDSDRLKQIYRELHHKIVREILFEKHTILPKIANVQESYIGIVPCAEYLKLICDDAGTLNHGLFYDNVRDFQGHNPVNTEIETTLQDASRNDRFALLNNGVTVVARDINKIGATFRLVDYQIVNGCQTSHILYRNRQFITDNSFLPIKLIVTTDSEVTNQIIQGTNRQTEVKLEAFESLTPLQKKIEELYIAESKGRTEPLYYERRSKQYDYSIIKKEQIITLSAQIICFLAIFLNEPHSTHRYYGELLTSYRNKVFNEAHLPLPYYTSGVALATLERLFNAGRLPRHWRQSKYQILMVFRLQNETNSLPPLNRPAIDKYCDALLKSLDNIEENENLFRRAGELVEKVRGEAEWRELPERTRLFTTKLIEASSNGRVERAATTTHISGIVDFFSVIKGYGFITPTIGTEDIYFNQSAIINKIANPLRKGDRVNFTTIQTERGLRGVNVELDQ